MASTLPSSKKLQAALVWLVLSLQSCSGFYLPGSYMHTYSNGDEIYAKVNSLTSIETELPYSYYSLSYCKPNGGIKKSAENLGELLMGDQIDNSPYRFRMNINETVYLCTTPPLGEEDVKLLKQRTKDMYQVNMILDNLPAMRFTTQNGVKIQWTGYPVGYTPANGNDDYIINHLKFRVLIHEYEGAGVEIIGTGEEGMGIVSEVDKKKASGYEIVGFEVDPCSMKFDPNHMTKLHMYDNVTVGTCPQELDKFQIIKEQERVSFTYSVEFVKSNVRWPSRWDAYLKMEGDRVHWFSILNSLMVIFFLAGIVFIIFLRTVRRDLTRYEELDKEAQAQMNEELSGWKLVAGDVFREPFHPKLLCVMVGDGVQITGMAVVTIIFAALGFMSPASRGMLLTGMIMLYLFLGVAAGYAGVRLWRTIKDTSEGWRSLSWAIACFFPGIAFVILTALNFLLWGSKSTGALPISLYFQLLSLWFCISVPLTLFGGFLGTRAEHIQYPVRTNQIPREIPERKCPSWVLVLGAGTLPFGTLFIELFFILSSIWLGRFYYVFGFLLIVFLLLVIVCIEVSVVLTYMHLCIEDWMWWWKAFFSSGSVAVYVFLYSIHYLVFDLRSLSGPLSATLYLGYSLLMAVAIMLSTGTIGLLASFYFVHYLFSSVKID
ncbi:transmembrane 9 superfamily member 12-like [Andrographis paniculata]|uniref:transmembrane 9 superfamily member 12-like n=1 Tax=Andrographis paniculata TaxID=175694 RepID=UPI0021E7AB7B|nr:transmembrane 9 superfamily member 12-like [Andrographis paniculata]XP_051120322.1 transmembrane 9 superfamily member 12-like [Andrographis paniculata]XP_051120323.1 transmembrane 9 superfamily member 12-like [Andrographis paniculata]XP_051120324.1 transmembrane 9 superfamily member 12-like [Andrographis paniculata]XP_051120325.1 transmembrane 9 superfamily member 12-like [Andrographis paniculata]